MKLINNEEYNNILEELHKLPKAINSLIKFTIQITFRNLL